MAGAFRFQSHSWQIFAQTNVVEFSPCFVTSFTVSGLVLQSSIHVKLIFVHVLTQGSNFILLHVCNSFPNIIYWITALPPLYVLGTLSKINDHTCMVLFLSFPFDSFRQWICFRPIPCCFDYNSFIIDFEVRKHNTFSFVLFAQNCFLVICGAIQI